MPYCSVTARMLLLAPPETPTPVVSELRELICDSDLRLRVWHAQQGGHAEHWPCCIVVQALDQGMLWHGEHLLSRDSRRQRPWEALHEEVCVVNSAYLRHSLRRQAPSLPYRLWKPSSTPMSQKA